jgi:hypothetical protein
MNERIKELAEQSGVTFHNIYGVSYRYGTLPHILERFAELIRQDERENIKRENESEQKESNHEYNT